MSLNASELLINKRKLIEQNESNNSEEIFTEKNKNWHKIIFQEIKKFQIQKKDNLMTCEWSHWITCYNNECQEHYQMKKQNQYYSRKSWDYISQDKKKWSKKSLYKISAEKQQWIKENHNHKKHDKINWKECINKQCRKHYAEKRKAWWMS